jgi:hypothetical protein
LKRLNLLFDPPQKDEWSVPSELSAEAALAYFQKHEGFTEGLELCRDLDADPGWAMAVLMTPFMAALLNQGSAPASALSSSKGLAFRRVSAV